MSKYLTPEDMEVIYECLYSHLRVLIVRSVQYHIFKERVRFVLTLCAHTDIICKVLFDTSVTMHITQAMDSINISMWVLFDTPIKKYFSSAVDSFQTVTSRWNSSVIRHSDKRNVYLSSGLLDKSHPNTSWVLFGTLISKVKETKICNRRIITIFQIEFSITNETLGATLHPQMNGDIPHQLKTLCYYALSTPRGVILHQKKPVCNFALSTGTGCYSTPNKVLDTIL